MNHNNTEQDSASRAPVTNSVVNRNKQINRLRKNLVRKRGVPSPVRNNPNVAPDGSLIKHTLTTTPEEDEHELLLAHRMNNTHIRVTGWDHPHMTSRRRQEEHNQMNAEFGRTRRKVHRDVPHNIPRPSQLNERAHEGNAHNNYTAAPSIGEVEDAAPAPQEAHSAGSGLPTDAGKDLVNTGMDVYNAVQDSRAAAKGMNRFEMYGGDKHPSGRPLGLSAPNKEDKAAAQRITTENSVKSISSDAMGVAGDLAGIFMESGETPDAVVLADNDVIETQPMQQTLTIQNTPQQNWTYTDRASRKFRLLSIPWNANTLRELLPINQLMTSNEIINNILRSFRFVQWDSITFGIHYETNGFYQGMGRIVYVPSWNYVAATDTDIIRYIDTGLGDEFYASENTEVEITVPWSLPIPTLTTTNLMQSTQDTRMLGAILIASLTPFRAPADALQSLNIALTMQVNGLTVSVPNDTLPGPAAGMRMEAGGDLPAQIAEMKIIIDSTISLSDDIMRYIASESPTPDVKRVEAALNGAIGTYPDLRAKFVALAQHYPPTPKYARDDPTQWQQLYNHLVQVIGTYPTAQRYLNAWTSDFKTEALAASVAFKDTVVQLKQVKAAMHLIIQDLLPELAFMRLESAESNSSIVYYPTSNRMQGRYSTTRLAGSYTPNSGLRVSDTSISYLRDIWTRMNTYTWTVAATTQVARINFSQKSLFTDATERPSMVDYLASMATMWSGTFDIKVQFSRSVFHHGKLMFVWTPLRTTNLTGIEATQYPYIVIDVAEQSEFIMKIPNTNMRPLRYVHSNTMIMPNNEGFLGTLHILPFVPLVGTTNVSATVDIVVWIRGHGGDGPDAWRIYNPSNVTSYNRGTNAADNLGMRMESAEIMTICEDTASGPIPIGFEEILDLKQILSRAQLTIVQVTATVEGKPKNFPPIGYSGYLNLGLTPGSVGRLPNLYTQLITPMYAYWNGDTDIMVQTDSDIVILRQLPQPPTTEIGGNAAFAGGPGMIRFQNATTMITAKLSPYGVNNFFLFPVSYNNTCNMDNSTSDLAVCPSTLIIDSYHSTDKRVGQEAVIYHNASENYTLTGYTALPDFAVIKAKILIADGAAIATILPPTLAARKESMIPYHELMQMRMESGRSSPISTGSGDSFDIIEHFRQPQESDEERRRDIEAHMRRDNHTGAFVEPVPTREELEEELLFLNELADITLEEESRRLQVIRLLQPVQTTQEETLARSEFAPPQQGLFRRTLALPGRIVTSIENLTEVTGHIRNSAQNMNNVTQNVDNVTQTFSDNLIQSIGRLAGISAGDVTTVALLVLDFGESILLNTTGKWIGFITKLCVAIGLRTGALNELYTATRDYFLSPHQFAEGNDGMRMEAELTPANISMMLSISVMAIGMKSSGGFDSKKNMSLWETMATRGRELHNLKQGVLAMTETFKFINDTIMECLIEYVYADDPEVRDTYGTTNGWKEIEKVSNLIKELHTYDSLRNICMQPERRAIFKDVFNRMNTLRHKVTMSKDRELTAAFFTMKASFENLISVTMDNNAESNVRIDPSHIYIYGGYGIGKSAISTAFAKAILISQYRDVIGNIYSRTEASKFHDNYMHQYVYQVDDGGMRNDAEIAMESIQRKSNVPYILEMADLKKKGMYFTSRCIITTSNTGYPNVNGITCNDAILRRRDMVLEAKFKPGYTSKRADFSHLEFNIMPPMGTGNMAPIKTGLTFLAVLHEVIITHGNLMASQARFVKGIDSAVAVDKVYTYTHADTVLSEKIYERIVNDMIDGSAEANNFIVKANTLAENIIPGPAEGPEAAEGMVLHGGGLSSMRRQGIQRRTYFMQQLPNDDDEEEDYFHDAVADPDPLAPGFGAPPHSNIARVAVDPNATAVVAMFRTVGLRTIGGSQIVAYGITYDPGTDITEMHMYEDVDDPMTHAIIDEVARQFNQYTPAMVRANFGVQSHTFINRVLRLFRVTTPSHVVARRVWNGLSAIGLRVFDLYVALPYSRSGAEWMARLSPIGIAVHASWRRTQMRLDRTGDWINRREREMEHRMPTHYRITYQLHRLLTVMPSWCVWKFADFCAKIVYKVIDLTAKLVAKIMALSPTMKIIGAILCGGFILYKYNQKDEPAKTTKIKGTENLMLESDTMRIQDHHHHDVPDDGQRYVHVHLCDKCNMAFTHMHKKHTFEQSSLYSHLCRRCYSRKLNKAAHDLMEGKKEVEVPKIEGEEEDTIKTESTTTNSSPKAKTTIIRLEDDKTKAVKTESTTTNSSPKAKTNIIRLEETTPMTKDQAMKLVNERVTEMQMEGNSDSNTMDVATRIYMNQGTIWRGLRHLNYLGIFGRTMIVPGHLFLPKAPQYVVKIKRLGMEFDLTLYERHIQRLYLDPENTKHNEYLLLDLTEFANIPAFADIRNQFISESEVGKLAGSKVLFQTKTANGTQIQKISNTCELLGEVVVTEKEITGFAKGFRYYVPTTPGDCGSAIMVMNTQIPGKIIGLHCMGHDSKDMGYGFLVTAEMVGTAKMSMECSNGPPLEYLHSLANEADDCDLPSYTPRGRHIILGLTKERELASPMKSDIIPSPIFDQAFLHTTEPVCLSGKDPRNSTSQSPLITSLEKFDTVPHTWDYVDRCVAREFSLKQFLKTTEDYGGPKRLLTLDEAINGIPGYIEPLNMRTSPGYPLILSKPPKAIGKSGFFTYTLNPDGSKHYTPKPALQATLNELLDCVKTEGWCKENWYMDWLKDERRKIDKVRAGKTRMFNIHNCAWLIINRMYFGAVLAAYQHAGHKNGSTIGINMHGPDVTELITYLKTAGENWWDLDIRNFDGTVFNEEVFDGLYVFKKWLRTFCDVGSELDVIGEAFFWRIHICGKVIYVPQTGIPSGHLFTATMDTEVNKQRRLKIWRALMKLFKKWDYLSLEVKEKLARDVGNGDDILGAVNEAIAHIYNPENIAAVLAEHGIEGTPPTKEEGGTIRGFRTWEHVTYLKCHFAHHETYPSLYVAKMNIDTIKELANWIRTSPDDMAALRSNVADMEQFLYPHGQQVYESTLGEVTKAFMAEGKTYTPTSYDYYDELYRLAHEIG